MTTLDESPRVPRASNTVDSPAGADDPTLLRETQAIPVAAPGDSTTTVDGSDATSYSPAEQRAIVRGRYGGFWWGTDFIGFAVASWFSIVFLGIVGAIVGAVGYQLNAPVPKVGSALTGASQSLEIGALAGSLVAVFLAYIIGGYAAGRMARFSGVKNGFGVWLWTILVAILLGVAGWIAGSSFNVGSQMHLSVDRATLTSAGGISVAVALVVMLLGSLLGGIMGERYHRSIDRDVEELR